MAACPECNATHPDGTEVCPADGATLVPDAVLAARARNEIAPGTLVAEYRVEEKIGEGGFGSVYRAVHPVIGKAVAIKLLSHAYSDNPQVVSRFIAEARAVNQIRHKNIVDIFAFGALPDGRQYLVMELLVGQPLDKVLRDRGSLPITELVPIMRGVLKALGAAHAAGLAHRDLKPENVLLCEDDEGVVTPKLIDFGIAKLLGDDSVEHRTRTGTPMGTPYYMSPEQCRGKNVDHRTDLYSVGAMLHVLATGRKPFVGDSAMDLLYKQMTEAPPRLSEHKEGLPAPLEDLVLSLLAKDPKDRPQTARAVAAVLDEILATTAHDATLPMPDHDAAREPPAKTTGGTTASAEKTSGAAARTVEPVSAEISRPLEAPGRSLALPIGVGVGALAAGAIALFVMRGDGSEGSTPSASATPTTAQREAPTASAAPTEAPVVTPTSTASASAVVVTPSAAPSFAPVLAPPSARPSAAVPQPSARPRATFDPNDVSFDD